MSEDTKKSESSASEERVRYEDDPKNQPKQEEKPAKLSAEEIDPETARRDETTVLATDQFDAEGNRVT